MEDSIVPSFVKWPKIGRLNHYITITEKIDGTNGAVIIKELSAERICDIPRSEHFMTIGNTNGFYYLVSAQCRTRLLRKDLTDDNFGFAEWVFENAYRLHTALGTGYHFGEWWGGGIQRNYGLAKDDKRFSLFNADKYKDLKFEGFGLNNVTTVPVLYEGPFSEHEINVYLEDLRLHGSRAVPGFMAPEGAIIQHHGAGARFKAYVE